MRRYYRIDHKAMFLFGYLFYLLTPYIVGTYNLFEGLPGMELYQGFFKLIPPEKLSAYIRITLSWLPAFFLGHFCFKMIRPKKTTLSLFLANPVTRTVPYIAIFLVTMLLIFTFLARNSIFGGYGSYDIAARGKLSTLLIAFNFFLLYQLLTRQRQSNLLVAGLLITAFLLLSMGGRLYVMQSFLIFLVYKTSFAERRWKFFRMVFVVLSVLIAASIIGIWRMGSSLTPDKAGYSLFAEPVFTWFSTSTFLIANDIPVFNVPLNFISSFINLVPNTVISLRPFIISTQNMGYITQSPLGADSVWTNFVINFGSVGSFFFLFITGFMLNFLRHLSERSRFWAVYYIMVCGMLPFQFFRDGFFLINKQLFFNFLIFPASILTTIKITIWLQRKILGHTQLETKVESA